MNAPRVALVVHVLDGGVRARVRVPKHPQGDLFSRVDGRQKPHETAAVEPSLHQSLGVHALLQQRHVGHRVRQNHDGVHRVVALRRVYRGAQVLVVRGRGGLDDGREGAPVGGRGVEPALLERESRELTRDASETDAMAD